VRSGEIFLSFEGRLDRERWLGAAGLFVATVVATYLATWLLWRGSALSFSAREAIRTFVQIALLVPWFALDWKRFHDIEHSGRWAMICPSLIILSRTWDWPAVAARAGTTHEPIGLALSWLHLAVAAWLAYALAYRRGEPGPNAYGPEPQPLSAAGRGVSPAS
jgi:uncharacterized membrane protein YhaH (DUF805 family)